MSRKYTDSKWKEIIEKENPEHVEVLKIIRKKGQKTKVIIKCLDHNNIRTAIASTARHVGCLKYQDKKIKHTNQEWIDIIQKNNPEHVKVLKIIRRKHKTTQATIKCSHGIRTVDASQAKYSGCTKYAAAKKRPDIANIRQYVNSISDGHYRIVSSVYKGNNIPLKFEWIDEHYFFKMRLSDFKRGQRAPIIHKSKGERILEHIFIDNNITYVSQYKYQAKDHLHFFDFYLPQYHTLVEYNGIQHYEQSLYFKRNLQEQHKVDKEKTDIAKKTGNKIIWIKYTYSTPQKIIKLLKKYGINCVYNNNIDYYGATTIISIASKYYKNHSSKETCQKYKIGRTTLNRYFQHYYGCAKKTKKDKIAKYYKSHLMSETCKKYNVSRPTVSKCFKDIYGTVKSTYLKKNMQSTKEKIAKYYKSHSLANTCQKYNVSGYIVNTCYKCYYKKTKNFRKIDSKEKDKIAKYYNNHSSMETCKKYDISQPTLNKYYEIYYNHPKRINQRDLEIKKTIASYYLTHKTSETIIYTKKTFKQDICRDTVGVYFNKIYKMTKTQYLKQKELTKKTA